MSAAIEPRRGPANVSGLEGLRVLVVHEWLYAWAGAERCLEQIFQVFPTADLLSGIVTPRMRREHSIAASAMESWVGRIPGARTKHRWFLPLHAAAFASFDTSRYDLVVSVSHALEKAIRAPRGGVHLCYCLTPPRFLYDLREAYASYASPLQRLALRSASAPLRALDQQAARRVDSFVSISRFVAERVRRTYGRESSVVYPPVSVRPTAAPMTMRSGEAPYLFSLGRLVPYKRVDIAVQVAERLGVRLVVAGDGPERKRLERLAGPHTSFVGEVSEGEAARLMAGCSAFLFCAEDDFGIAPVEANAHGVPVVAYARGGALETLRDNVTGVFFAAQTVDAASDAVRRCLDTRWEGDVLRANAARFAPERFRDGFRAAVSAALAPA